MDDVLREALAIDRPEEYFGERRLVLEYRNGELYEGEAVPASEPLSGPQHPLPNEGPGEQPGMS